MSAVKLLNTELKSYWEITGVRDSSGFFRMLPMMLPGETTLYFEGVSISKNVKLYLQAHSVSPNYELSKGTIWPRSAIFHVPVNDAFLEGLAKLADNHAEPEVADHIHAYAGDKTIFTWFDVFNDPLFVTIEIPETKIQDLCNTLNARYKRVPEAG